MPCLFGHFQGHEGGVTSVAVHDHDAVMISGGADNTVRSVPKAILVHFVLFLPSLE